MSGLTYVERRSQALALAAATDGWGRPPRPEGKPWVWAKRYLPHSQAVHILGRHAVPPPDQYGFVTIEDSLRLRAYFEAKEKNQNREKFD